MILTKKITLTVAQISNMEQSNAPIQLLAAPGAGKVINILSVFGVLRFNTTPWTAATQICVSGSGAISHKSQPNFLDQFNNMITMQYFPVVVPAMHDEQLIENMPVIAYTQSSNPSGGDSEADIYVTYEVIEIAPCIAASQFTQNNV